MEEVRRINAKGQLVCSIAFNGKEYRRYPNGKHPNYYYHKWKRNGKQHTVLLHHAVYEHFYGGIPEGKVIHHKDFNALNNSIENLVAVSLSEHSRIHRNLEKWSQEHSEEMRGRRYSRENWKQRREKVISKLAITERQCDWCGELFVPTNTHQRFCSKRCHHRWQYKAPENDIELTCQWCGKTFKGNKYLKPKTCGSLCAHQMSGTLGNQNREKGVV